MAFCYVKAEYQIHSVQSIPFKDQGTHDEGIHLYWKGGEGF